jgi:hypothetical protein
MAKSQQKPKPDSIGLFDDKDVENWFEDEDGADEDSDSASFETIEQKYAKSQLRVVRESRDYTLDYLQHALKKDKFIINVAPDYQRRQRWSIQKRSQLIESFLMNIPIPSVYLFEKEYNEYEVVDGRQRLDSIREYLSNGFALTGLSYWKELNKKRFEQLPPIIQKGLLRRSLAAVVLLAEASNPEHDDFDVRNVLFERLNTGGEKLNPQELRNALYPGQFNKMLLESARYKTFVQVWGIPEYTPNEETQVPDKLANNTLYKTMADCELILRFFAIREAIIQNRKGSLRKLLDSCMKRHEQDDSTQVEFMQTLFKDTIDGLVIIFETDTFILPESTRPSRPLYDALMVAYSMRGQDNVEDDKSNVKAKMVQAFNNDYDAIVRRGNTIEDIKERIAVAKTILFKQ